MQPVLKIENVEATQEWLEKNAELIQAEQSIDRLINYLGLLSRAMAFVNGQMAVAKKQLLDKKTNAYEAFVELKLDMAASLAKDYIAARCSQEQYEYDLCERVSRTVTHTAENLRTCISALKEEIKIQNYASQQRALT